MQCGLPLQWWVDITPDLFPDNIRVLTMPTRALLGGRTV